MGGRVEWKNEQFNQANTKQVKQDLHMLTMRNVKLIEEIKKLEDANQQLITQRNGFIQDEVRRAILEVLSSTKRIDELKQENAALKVKLTKRDGEIDILKKALRQQNANVKDNEYTVLPILQSRR